MHSMINSEDRTNEVENYRTLEMDRQNGNFNSSGSSHEKNTTVLTLFTYPESSTMKNVSIKLPFSVSKNTAIQVQQPLSKPRTHRIIDKLSELTNIKLRNAASAKYRNLGHVHEPKLINGSAQSTKNEYNIISNFNISLDYALKRKPDERSSASLTSLSNKSTVKTLTNGSFTATSPGGEHLSPHAENKEPIAYKVSTGSTMTNASANLPVNNADSETLEHVSEESRVITADQIGMNRPTRVPFHFTTTQFPPITTTVREITPAIHSQKVPSPHNHIFAPTQDPINIAHGEDVNGDDLKDFHVAHLTFGTKVGFVTPAISPSRKNKVPITYGVGHKVAAPEDLRDNKSYFPPPQSNESNNFNSATGHNHLIKKSNNINEQLPFFKEQGGIFEHHQQPNLQNGPNEIQQRQKIAGVTYASKGPAEKPQANVYLNPKITAPLHSSHPQTPQYIQIPQHVYLAPVPVQQTVQPFNQNPIPITNFYNMHSAVPPVQVPAYYASPALQHQYNPTVSLSPQYTKKAEIIPGNMHYRHTSLEPNQRQINSNSKNLYYSPTRNNRDPYLHEHGRPPPRGDPESDTFYGSPVSLPPKPQSTHLNSAKTANLKYSRTEPRIGSYDDRRHSEGKYIRGTKPRQRQGHSELSRNRVAPVSHSQGNGNYNEDYENDELQSIPDTSNTGNQKFRNYDTSDSFSESPERYSFRRPNFENPNIRFSGRNSLVNNYKNRPMHSNRHSYGEDSGIEHAAAGDIPKRNFPVLDPIYTRTIQQYDQETLKPESSQENDGNNNDEFNDSVQPPTSPNSRRYNTDSDRHTDEDASQIDEEDEDDGGPKPRRQHQRNSESEEEEISEVPSTQASDEEDETPSKREEEHETPRKQTTDEEEEDSPRKQTADEEEEDSPHKQTTDEEEEDTPRKQTTDDEDEEDEQEEQPKTQQRSNKKKPPKKPKDEKSGNLDDDIDGIEREFGSFGTGGGNRGHTKNVQYHPILG